MLSTNSKLQMKKHRAVNAVLLVASRLRRFQFISSRFLAIANTAAFSHSILSSRSLNRSNRDATLTVRAMSMPPLGVKRLYSIHRPGDGTSGIRACIQPTSISHFSLISGRCHDPLCSSPPVCRILARLVTSFATKDDEIDRFAHLCNDF